MARQRGKHGVLLVAWHGLAPIGDVYLRLEEAEEPEVRERLPGVPLLTRLEVAPEHRNRRIGTRLTAAAEQSSGTDHAPELPAGRAGGAGAGRVLDSGERSARTS